MGNLDYKPHYRRNLPHIQPPSATLFVTFRLAGSLPRAALEEAARRKAELEKELAAVRGADERRRRERDFRRQRFARLEKYLDEAETGPTWLRQAPVGRAVADALRRRDGGAYRLEAYCVMPNHVHAVFTPLPAPADGSRCVSLAAIMHAIKGGTAYEANQLLGRSGPFWEHESYDHYVRDERELERILWYVLGNPVKAGLAADWRAWPWSYCRLPL
jgi:REP element-mobilizing transposase RayT